MFATAFRYQQHARQMIALASMACFLSVVLYGAFLLITVGKAAASEAYAGEARDISAALAELQARYLMAQSGLTPEKATAIGLVAIPSAQIAYIETNAYALSLR